MRRVVITGYGSINPAGIGSDKLWEGIIANENFIKPISRFDASSYESTIAGEIPSFNAGDFISKRVIKKTDRFTHLALAAVHLAVEHAGLNLSELSSERIGLMVGNVLGGWEFAEKELRNLWKKGEEYINPYQATAWFPTAAQGYLSIINEIKGKSRTFVADRASGAYALVDGIQTIKNNEADVVLAGGTEAPLSPYGWLCCQTSGYMADSKTTSNCSEVYKPFSYKHQGTVFGEGSTFLVLEELEHALTRGAPIYGELTGWGITNDAYYPYYTHRPDGEVLARSIKKSLDQAQISERDISYISGHGSAVPAEDATEIYALERIFGSNIENVPVTCSKSSFGHLLGAAAPTDLVLAVESLKHKIIPGISNFDKAATGFERVHFIQNPNSQSLNNNKNHVLLISRGMGGNNVSFIVSSI
ncbi:beta-ketoacyl-[acyl-carrier-protein] synthase family protein [Bacillus cereus]|uniref:beta-ketoacyl-[acyl-carrier-protein] synthase family protein n=1 Tax=Bacillus cereus TaxID=1396 RepID=UPI000BFE1B48|nr:beta-ketoacyl-[acyl-carrier-protein] synthase family protein [Bacillus cereus]PGK36719.1 beta-ketoacyl synthase [Bacillus cereus]